MKNKFISALFLIAIVGCSETKTISYKRIGENGRKLYYYVKIPKGYIAKRFFVGRAAEYEGGVFFIYPDSAMIFISDNVRPGAFYPDAYRKYGKGINLIFLIRDTITISGVDDSGRYWEDRKFKPILYGYRKVPTNKKEQFDKILDGVKSSYGK